MIMVTLERFAQQRHFSFLAMGKGFASPGALLTGPISFLELGSMGKGFFFPGAMLNGEGSLPWSSMLNKGSSLLRSTLLYKGNGQLTAFSERYAQ
jgi:hypothetical protein